MPSPFAAFGLCRFILPAHGNLFCAISPVLIWLACCLPALPADNQLWQRQNIYQIITDRFYNGDPANDNVDGNYDPAGHTGTSIHGGDFRGIEQKLDYVKALGATAIWISPVVLNVRGEFHGYDGCNFYKVDPHWGTLADLQHMIQAAHARGLLVIDDIVVNHGGHLLTSDDSGYPKFKYPPDGYDLRLRNSAKQYPAPFELNATNSAITNLFHNQGSIRDYNDPVQVELGALSGLDDFKTETPYVREQMTKIYQYWIAQAGFDGFRIDTVKHVEMGFWQEWCPAVHNFAAAHGKPDFFLFGEIPHHSDFKCGSYTGVQSGGPFKLDSVLDYTLYFKINDVFARATGNTKQIEDHYAAVAANYDPSAQTRLVTFLDNHDQPRFLSSDGASNNVERLKVALAFLYTARGVPCLYYGTEQGFSGKKDPFDREDLFDGQFKSPLSGGGDNFDQTHPLFQLIARLNNFRRLYSALQIGGHINLWNDPKGPGLFAYARRRGTQEVLVVFNTATAGQILPRRSTIYPPGTKLVNLLKPAETITILENSQTPPIDVPGTAVKIFLAQSQMLPLDPTIIKISPAHDSKNVRKLEPIVIQFSQPMDIASVEAAFSMVPLVRGKFTWSPTHDMMTFTPQGMGFPLHTTMEVRVGDNAREAATGGKLYAGFESRFKTAAGSVERQ